MFYLKTLGSLSLYRAGDRDPVLSGTKPLLLLAVLAMRGRHPARREDLAELLWPASDPTRARRSLRQALFTLSKHTGKTLIQTEESSSRLRLDAGQLSADVWEFHEALEEEDYGRAVDLYAGRFLADFERKVGVELEHWIEAENSRVQIGLEVAYNKLIGQALAGGDAEAAVRRARRYADLSPLDDRAQATLVRTLKATGDEVGALQAFEAYKTLLREELEAEPAEALQESMERVREELLKEPDQALDKAESARVRKRVPAPEPGFRAPPPQQADAEPSFIRRALLTSAVALGVVAIPAVLGLLAWALLVPRVAAGPLRTLSARVHAVVGQGHAAEVVAIEVSGTDAEIRAAGFAPTELPSPDGRLVATTVRAPDGWELAVRDRESGAVRALTQRPGDEYAAVWSPDGRFLLYGEVSLSSDGSRASHRPMVYDLESDSERPLGDMESNSTIGAVWSPDGSRVAFTLEVGGDTEVIVADFDGGYLRNVSTDRRWDGEPAWSPDGRRLLFVSERSGNRGLFTVRWDGTGLSEIEGTRGAVESAVWASGDVVMFIADIEGNRDLWALDASSGRLTRLTRRGDLAVLLANMGVGATGSWIERVEIQPRVSVASPGERLELRAAVTSDAGDSLAASDVGVRWSVAGSAARLDSAAVLTVREPGLGRVVASVRGWRADTLEFQSLPLLERDVPAAFVEDWADGIRAERWMVVGEPEPYARESGGPGGRGVFVNNGDAHFQSGVVSRRVFPLVEGITIEAYGRMRFTGQLNQTYALALYPATPRDSTAGWLDTPPLVKFTLTGPSADRPPEARIITAGHDNRVPFPDAPWKWHLYVLEIIPDGTVKLIVDGTLHWRSLWRLPAAQLTESRVGLGDQSYETTIMHGPVRVYPSPKYRLTELPDTLRTGPDD